MSYAENAATMCALMDAQITDAEWEAQRQRNKLLHDCRTKGFARLAMLGQFKGGIKISAKKAARDHTPLEFATIGARLVNDENWTRTKVCKKFGRNVADLRYYCDKFGIDLDRNKRTWDYDATYRRIYHFINREGFRMKDAASKIGCSPKVILDILKAKGRKYNAKTVKIEKIKK